MIPKSRVYNFIALSNGYTNHFDRLDNNVIEQILQYIMEEGIESDDEAMLQETIEAEEEGEESEDLDEKKHHDDDDKDKMDESDDQQAELKEVMKKDRRTMTQQEVKKLFTDLLHRQYLMG